MGGKSPYPEVEQYLKNRYGGRFEIEEAAGNKIFLRLDMDVENLGTEKRPFLYSWHLRQERKAGFSGLSRRSLWGEGDRKEYGDEPEEDSGFWDCARTNEDREGE